MTLNSLKNWRKKHLLFADAVLALMGLAAVVCGVVYFNSTADALALLDGSRSASYATLAAVAGSLLGFILTAVSIIAAFGQTPRFDTIRNSPVYQDIFDVYIHTTHLLAVTTVWAMVALVLDTDETRYWAVSLVSFALVALSVVRVWRCIWALEKFVKIATKPLPETQSRRA